MMAAVFVVSTCRKTAFTFFFSGVKRCRSKESRSKDAIPFLLYSFNTPKDNI